MPQGQPSKATQPQAESTRFQQSDGQQASPAQAISRPGQFARRMADAPATPGAQDITDLQRTVDNRAVVQRLEIDPSRLLPQEVMYLQRTIGNQATARLLGGRRSAGEASAPLLQPKLRVGPVDDRYEREADRVANHVLRLASPPPAKQIQRHRGKGNHRQEEDIQLKPVAAEITPLVQRASDQHGRGCSCSGCVVQRQLSRLQVREMPRLEAQPSPGAQIQRSGHGSGCGCAKCAGLQLKRQSTTKDGSFDADESLASDIRNLQGRGAPLPDTVRRDMEPRFGADFSGVRVHTDARAVQLNRDLNAQAFTHGQHIAFAAGKFSPHSASGKRLLAHELTHTIQQTGAKQLQRQTDSHGPGCSCSACSRVQRTITRSASRQLESAPHTASPDLAPDGVSSIQAPVVQRHSTHEHYLLGTLSPDELSSLPLIREQVATAKAKDQKKFVTKIEDHEKWGEVIHLIEQEMGRLLEWQKQKPEEQLEQQDLVFGSKIGKVKKVDEKWQVPYVRIPTKDGTSVICTYGELNTLADMFGAIEDFANTDPKAIVQMLQGVRQRVYIELYKIYEEIGASEYYKQMSVKKMGKKSKKFRPDTSWSGAIGFTGKEKGPAGAASAVKQYEKATKVGGQFTASNASAALARNACHFAPETWYTWRRYHDKAREFARESYSKRIQAKMLRGEAYDERMDQWLIDNSFTLVNPFDLPDFQTTTNDNNDTSNPFDVSQQPDLTSVDNSWNPFESDTTEDEDVDESWNPFSTPEPTGVTGVSSDQPTAPVSQARAIFNLASPDYELNDEQADELEAEATDLANKALLYSGFGDHYLQDAYASGHLIDKTKIMQWFIQWHNTRGTKKWKDSPSFHMMAAIAEQELTSNPQMMENVRGGLSEKLGEVGVQVKDHILFMMWWRRKAFHTDKAKSMTAMSAVEEARKPGHPLRTKIGEASDAIKILDQLASLGFADKKEELGVATYTLKEAHIKTLSKEPDNKAAYHAKRATGDYMEEAREFYYVAYAKFLDSNYFQLITNYLHNIFCAQGLEVQTKAGGAIGRIYGDANMINAGGQAGVRHSAVTGQWAHEAIYDILDHGSAAHSTQDIEARFPAKVKLEFGASQEKGTYIGLENWLGALKTECLKDNGLFADGIDRFASTVMKKGNLKLTSKEQTITPIMDLDLNPPTHDPIF